MALLLLLKGGMAHAAKSNRRLLLLTGLIVLQSAIAVKLWLLPSASAHPVLGFLIKNGTFYTLAFKNADQQYELRNFDKLTDALRVAHTDLKLSEGVSAPEHELEFAWQNKRSGAYMVFWKTLTAPDVNHLTFQSRADADYFLRVFRSGSYTTSLFGHSILFVSKTNALD